jgi:hypothetical protein
MKKKKSGRQLWIALLDANLFPAHPEYGVIEGAMVQGLVMARSQKEAERLFAAKLADLQYELVDAYTELWEEREVNFGLKCVRESYEELIRAAQSGQPISNLNFILISDDKAEAELTRLAEVAKRSKEPQFNKFFLLPWTMEPHKPALFVETLAEARKFLRSHGLPTQVTKRLSEDESKALRQAWCQTFARAATRSVHRHRCPHCRGGESWCYDWHVLSYGLVPHNVRDLPPIAEMAHPDQRIALFFEACNLPVFVCPARALEGFQPKFLVDLYLTPVDDLAWTQVYTHEPDCGPYFCWKREVNGE